MSGSIWHAGVALLGASLVAGGGPAPRPTPVVAPRAATALHAGGRPDSIAIDPRASSIRWSGGTGASSAGTVALTGGLLVLRHEKLEIGRFTVDLRSLAVRSAPAGGRLSARAVRAAMTGASFLDVDRYPTATFVASGAERIGPARWRVAGTLSLHGVTQPLSLDADVQWPDVGHLVATSTFVLDARRWGIGDIADVSANELRMAVTLDGRRMARAVAGR